MSVGILEEGISSQEGAGAWYHGGLGRAVQGIGIVHADRQLHASQS